MRVPKHVIALLALMFSLGIGYSIPAQAALNDANLVTLATGDNDEKIAALDTIAADADLSALPALDALAADQLMVVDGKQIIIVADGIAKEAASGKQLPAIPANAEEIILNNRVRGAVANTIAALQLISGDRDTRLASIQQLKNVDGEGMRVLLGRALKAERDPDIIVLLRTAQAGIQLKNADAAIRLSAVRDLADTGDSETKELLLTLLEKREDSPAEADPVVRAEIKKAVAAINNRMRIGEYAGMLFTGMSLGSILLLAALGLAITYGLMGVINMAHGELIMIGAYAAYLTQNLVRTWAPELFEFYPLLAIPVSFCASAIVGIIMEKLVIRHLYGRPLETLLATWGISLILIQLVRTVFGAQNVPVENPEWLSGGIQVMSNLVLPYNRIAIIVFAALVVIGMSLILTRTRLGLFVRAVTQNRAMASCVGVATPRVDTMAFGLGAGIAGLAGCALAQIGNVGPDLGQAYIIDSFMVVVTGGVGQLAGTVYAAMGLGLINKLFEAQAGAVLAKIAILVIIIVFIQKRPQGLFAVRGRFADN